MKHIIIFPYVCLILNVLLFTGCSKPEPGEPVSFDEVITQKWAFKEVDGKKVYPRVSLEGYLGLKNMFTLQTDSLMIRLFSEPDRKGKEVTLSLDIGNERNQIKSLPDKYKYSDLKVRTNEGKIVGPEDKVRIHGKRAGGYETCYIDVDLVESF